MKIDASFDVAQSLGKATPSPRTSNGFSFQTALDKASSANAASSVSDSAASKPKEDAAEAAMSPQLKELMAYLSKSPAQLMRESILKSMGLTEESLKSLPPEKQAAIEATIAAKIKEMMQGPADGAVHNAGTAANPAISALSASSLL